ncbi:cation transport protein-domain-containing protein [Leptodontidium sp. MPI-SDFR-AT-0119]|nr:cation transport protein-domain-containing protein [Leptodontidium sp. MPI-SDFR-AT-0119]
MESTDLPEEEKVPPSKPPPTLVTRCLNLTSSVKTKFMLVLPGAEGVEMMYNYISRFSFVTLHWVAFILWSLISSTLIWAIQGRQRTIGYLTCLFFAVSSVTDTGLVPANVSALNTFQQITLCINFILGSAPITGIVVLTVRKTSMESRYIEVIENLRIEEQAAQASFQLSRNFVELPSTRQETIMECESTKRCSNDAFPDLLSSSAMRKATVASNFLYYWNGFLSKATVGRNSTFHGLSRSERESVVCVEYRSIKLLRLVVALYVFLLQLLGAIGLALYFQLTKPDVVGLDGVNPVSLGIFNSISAFNNAGMSLMNNSMMPFRTNSFPVLIMSFLMLAGNTGFPIFLRMILWVMLKTALRHSRYNRTRETLTYILKYPRRVYTHLFPTQETWYLALGLLVLNGIDWIALEVSARHLSEMKDLSLGNRILIGLFQSLSVRCSVFNIVTIPALPVALLVLYIGMMYISAFPVTIIMRTSNVYEERSLGVYSPSRPFQSDQASFSMSGTGVHGKLYFVGQQLSSQISYDIWSMLLALIIIGFREGGGSTSAEYNVFPVIFEVFSAYANIGLSMGLADQSYSLCGSWHRVSQICMMALMLRGLHRSLPHSIDRAIQLPDKNIGSREEADEREREHELARELEMADELKID